MLYSLSPKEAKLYLEALKIKNNMFRAQVKTFWLNHDPKIKMRNSTFMKESTRFREACEIVNTPITIRQASKFRNRTGIAHSITP